VYTCGLLVCMLYCPWFLGAKLHTRENVLHSRKKRSNDANRSTFLFLYRSLCEIVALTQDGRDSDLEPFGHSLEFRVLLLCESYCDDPSAFLGRR
jgi:hypothetical protein